MEDFTAEQGQGWAEEFGHSQTGATASLGKADQQQDHAATLAQTKALAQHLAKDGNPKMKNSQFLQFLSKMSQGEIILEDNQVGLDNQTVLAGALTHINESQHSAARHLLSGL